MKKLSKEAGKKKGSSASAKDVTAKGASTKKKAHSSDDDHSPARSQADENEAVTDDDDIQWQTDTSTEAAKQRIQEQLSSVTADMVMLSTTEEKKKSVKSPACESKGHENGASVPNAHLADQIKDFLKKGASASQLKSFLSSLSGTPKEIMDALFVALFNGIEKGFAKEVTKKKNYLATTTQEEGAQMVLLHSFESFCGKASPAAVKEVALVLKVLYDNDVLEEEFIAEWYQKGLSGANKNSPVWKNAKPFIEWLQNAESETEED